MNNTEGASDPARSIIAALADQTASAGPIAEALRIRANIVGLSDASHDAVLTPREPGDISHALRAALAARMARHNGDDAMAAHYDRLLDAAKGDEKERALARPGAMPDGDPRLAAIVRHVDLLTTIPREATKGDVEALRAAGVTDADIVRIAELAAFVSFQARFVAGLRLMGSTQ